MGTSDSNALTDAQESQQTSGDGAQGPTQGAPTTTTDSQTAGQEVAGSADAPTSETSDSPDTTDANADKLKELEDLLSSGVITQDQFDDAQERLKSGATNSPENPATAWGNTGDNVPPGPTPEETAAAAAAQSPGEPQTVPEVRPQGSQGGGTPNQVSDASRRIDGAPAATAEEIAAANSEENKKAAIEASRLPNLEVGQRVTILEPNPEAGRMAFVSKVVYKDGIQELLAGSGSPERRFAEALSYIVITRDGRSDTLVVEPDQVKALEVNEGWGRGQI